QKPLRGSRPARLTLRLYQSDIAAGVCAAGEVSWHLGIPISHGERKVAAVELIAKPMAPGISDRLVSDSGPPMASTRLQHWPACAEGNEKGRPPGSQFKVFKRKARLTSTRSAHQRWCVLSRCPLCNR